MAKPRVFVSSTYYDLKHIRASLDAFIHGLGYEPILFESGDIPFHHDKPLDISCYDAVENAHIFVLMIGGRYGSSASGQNISVNKVKAPLKDDLDRMYSFYNSITVEEYKRARQQDVPIYIFLEKGVAAEYQTYKENKDSTTIRYAHVDNVSVFRLLDEIFAEHRNNLVREFETFDDISSWLKDQWAGLFADYLSKRKSDSVLSDLTTQVQTLNQVVDALRSYSEAIVRKVEPNAEVSERLIKQVEDKLAYEIIRNNPLIKFIRSQVLHFNKGDIEDGKVIAAVAKSGDLDSFLAALELPSEVSEEMGKYRTPATRDFISVRKQLSELTPLAPLFKNAPPVRDDIPHRILRSNLGRGIGAAQATKESSSSDSAKPTTQKKAASKSVNVKKIPVRKVTKKS